MSLSRIQRLNVDSTSFEENQNVSLAVSLQTPIVKVPQEYNVVLEKAEIPITGIPLGVIDEPYWIVIDYPPSAPAHPVLEHKLNIFTIQGAYFSISDFVDKINKIIHDDLVPAVSCGTFSYDRTNHRLEYKFGDSNHRSTMALGVEMWFDSRLIHLLDGIPNLFSPTSDPTISSTLKMHKVTWSSFVGAETDVVIGHQSTYLLPRLFGFKSIRITSSLPTRPYIIYDQQTNQSVTSNLLAEIIMDSQNFQEGRTNVLYIPQNLIFNEMTGVTELNNFQIWFHIHYKNGLNYPLVVKSNEYLSLTLAFYKI